MLLKPQISSQEQPARAYIVDGCGAPGEYLGRSSFGDVLSYENDDATRIAVYVAFEETSNLSARLTINIR